MVIRREYLERVRKKSFWLGTLFFPLLLLGVIFFLITLTNVEELRKIALVDATGKLGGSFQAKLSEEKLKNGKPAFQVESMPLQGDLEATRKALEPRVNSGELYAVLTAGDDVDAEGNFRFYARSVGNLDVQRTLQRALREAVIGLRLERSNLTLEREKLEKLLAPIELESFQVAAGGQTKKKGFWDAYVGTYTFVMILYMAMLLYGVAVMRGILEEKSNRIMEVLLGSLSPDQLMTGKILGIGLVGLTQMAIYAAAAGVARLYIAASPMATQYAGAADAVSLVKMCYFLIFFLLGYFLYTSLFAAVGAVCNSEQEAQNLQTPVVMCLAIPMAATIFFVGNPDSTAATVISMIPLFTPMVMFMRISVLTPPFWQIALSIVLLLAANYVFFKAVGRIFRIGVLMYGKRPTVPEILRWARG
jgi:ABC-2 type transport system permease protein